MNPECNARCKRAVADAVEGSHGYVTYWPKIDTGKHFKERNDVRVLFGRAERDRAW